MSKTPAQVVAETQSFMAVHGLRSLAEVNAAVLAHRLGVACEKCGER